MTTTAQKTTSQCPSEWGLQRYHLGYLSDEDAGQLEHHLANCPHCRSYLLSLQEEELPALSWDTPVQEGASSAAALVPFSLETKPKSVYDWFLQWSRPFSAVAALGVFLCAFWVWNPIASDTDSLWGKQTSGRSKGADIWNVYIKKHTDHSIKRAVSGALVHVQDTLRFHFDLDASLYVMVLSLNEKGDVSLYYPYPTPQAEKLGEGSHQLPKEKSIPLDDYVGKELFVMLAAKKTFSLEKAKAALKKTYQKAQKKLDRHFEVEGFFWQKCVLIRKVQR